MVIIIVSFALPLPSVCFQVQPQEPDIWAVEGQPRDAGVYYEGFIFQLANSYKTDLTSLRVLYSN